MKGKSSHQVAMFVHAVSLDCHAVFLFKEKAKSAFIYYHPSIRGLWKWIAAFIAIVLWQLCGSVYRRCFVVVFGKKHSSLPDCYKELRCRGSLHVRNFRHQTLSYVMEREILFKHIKNMSIEWSGSLHSVRKADRWFLIKNETLGIFLSLPVSAKRDILHWLSFAFSLSTRSCVLLILDPTKAALCGITGVMD